MSTAGIVAEYNPFHNGHAYHIARTRENGASAVVCVMSSWFVQRGETALMHPNARAHMALMNGADLVVSLPVPWACAAAQTFAMVGMVADHAGNADAKQHPMVQANSTLVLTISFLTFLVADIVYLYFMADLEKKAALEREVSSLKYARQLEEQHFKQIEEKRYEVAKIRHDINNQLASIKNMVHSRHIEQAEELIGELENTVRNTQEYRYCSIPVVNAVISEKNKEAEKYGIRLVTKIDIPDSAGITQHHLCSAFANMIDNAIRAERGFTEKDSDKKIISVDAVSDSVSVYITVRNYVSGVEISREDDSSLHGYGQKILGDIAEIYSGTFNTTEKNGEYTCTLVMQMKERQTENI